MIEFRSVTHLWWLLLLPPGLFFLFSRERVRLTLANRFVNERLRGVSNPARFLRPYFLGAGLLAALVALAGPRLGFEDVPLQTVESNRVLVLDLSESMLAEDVGASRIDAARALLRRVIENDQGRVALVVFSGAAEIVAPLTNDRSAVEALLASVVPGELESSGSDLGAAIRAALNIAGNVPGRATDVILVSDGEHRGPSFQSAVEEARKRNVRISTIVIGTEKGATIPGEQQRPLRDEEGRVVITRSDAAAMREIAVRTGGQLFINPFQEKELAWLSRIAAESTAVSERKARIPIERYQWPLALGMFAFLAGSLLHRGAE